MNNIIQRGKFTSYFTISKKIMNIIHTYLENIDLMISKESFEQLQDYTSRIESMYFDLQSFKHDYLNIMASMSGYIDSKDIEGLEKYYNESIMPLSNRIIQTDLKLNQLMNIQIMELKSLLFSKFIYAHKIGINVTIDIPEPIYKISMNIIDLIRVIGIYLDNGIEAAIETPHPKLFCGLIPEGRSIAIIITNTFIEHGAPVSKLSQYFVSSKGENRGIGLNNAKKILNNYSNIMKETRIQHQQFIQHFIIATK
jgi:two-component system sensor histidine kinase AgrC